MDENDPQYKKLKERKWEVHRSILEFEGRLMSTLTDLDYGIPSNDEVRRYSSELSELKQEYAELESKLPTNYSNADIHNKITRKVHYVFAKGRYLDVKRRSYFEAEKILVEGDVDIEKI